jgi:hypothetical protein
MVAPLFVYAPPRIFFSPAEQELLTCALLGETDEQLALSLNLVCRTAPGTTLRTDESTHAMLVLQSRNPV